MHNPTIGKPINFGRQRIFFKYLIFKGLKKRYLEFEKQEVYECYKKLNSSINLLKQNKMDSVVYLDSKAKELENLTNGKKNMIIRGAMGRKLPYGKVNIGDVLYFIENKGDGLVKAKATVFDVLNSEKMTKEESIELVERYQENLLLDKGLLKRFGGKRYIVLITIKEFELLTPFKIDRSNYGNMDDWLPVGEIDKVKTELLPKHERTARNKEHKTKNTKT